MYLFIFAPFFLVTIQIVPVPVPVPVTVRMKHQSNQTGRKHELCSDSVSTQQLKRC